MIKKPVTIESLFTHRIYHKENDVKTSIPIVCVYTFACEITPFCLPFMFFRKTDDKETKNL